MMLMFLCRSCKEYSTVKSKAQNRYDLRDELGGPEVKLQCSECLSTNNLHVNRIMAQSKISSSVLLIAIAVAFVLCATFALSSLGFISTATFVIPLAMYGVYKKQEENTIRQFNKTLVS